MIRLLLRLIGIKDFEPCASCETLKKQLEFANQEKKELTNTLLSILKPKEVEAAPVEINPINQSAGIFSRRRTMLEARDREEARILQEARNLGRPDNLTNQYKQELSRPTNPTVEELEKELGIEEKKVEAS